MKSGLSYLWLPYIARLIASRVVTGLPHGCTMNGTPFDFSHRRTSERRLSPDSFRRWSMSAIIVRS